MFQRILVAIDGSKHADTALSAAASFANLYGATLTVCYVKEHGPIPASVAALCDIEPMGLGTELLPNIARDINGDLAIINRLGELEADQARVYDALATLLVDTAVNSAREAGVSAVTGRIEEGEPATAILACAKDTQAELIVMGRRGLSDLKGLLIGSVSHRVESHAECACLTTR